MAEFHQLMKKLPRLCLVGLSSGFGQLANRRLDKLISLQNMQEVGLKTRREKRVEEKVLELTFCRARVFAWAESDAGGIAVNSA